MTNLRHLRLGFLGLAAALAAALAWGALRQPARRAAPRPENVSIAPPSAERLQLERDSIARRLADAGEYESFVRKFAHAWPLEWSTLIDGVAQRQIAGTPPETSDALFAQALRELRRTRGVLASKANGPALTRIFETQAATLAALSAVDNRQCVDFLLGVQNRAFLDFSASHRALIAGMAEAAIDAILDGQENRVARTAPGDADFDLLEQALVANGLGKPEIDALLDGRYPDPPLADDRLCAAGLTYLKVLRTLPEEPRLRLYAFAVELMAKL